MQRGRHARFVACTALGAVELLQRSGIEVGGLGGGCDHGNVWLLLYTATHLL